MKWISYAAYALLTSSLLIFTACDDDDVPPEENPEEEITNVVLTFTPAGGGSAVTATSIDPDGDGPDNSVETEIVLAANTAYTLSMQLTDARDPSDIEHLTEEIEDEDETPKEEILEDFREAWKEAMTGKTTPASELWKDIEDV